VFVLGDVFCVFFFLFFPSFSLQNAIFFSLLKKIPPVKQLIGLFSALFFLAFTRTTHSPTTLSSK